ncbi:MAG: Trigger factor [Gemmatimonadaceae bacterium]|nr:Trigger factor [Gemmatimonadaceae bacterium]
MDIQITPTKTDGIERLVRVEVSAESFREAQEQAARRYSSKVRLPGFRPGKAPAAMVLRRFGDAIRQETVETIVQEAYKQVVEGATFKLAAQPHVHDLKFEEGQPLSFELHLEVRPELDLARTGGFRVTRTQRTVGDSDVAEQIDSMREHRATWSPIDEKPREGDMVTAVLATSEDGGEIGEGREFKVVLGAGQAIAGIEELIMETAPGSSTERPVKWPDDFPDEDQRSKTKLVRVLVNDVKRKSLPEGDDAFAREVGDFESFEALREAVRADLRAAAERDADAEVRQKLLDEIIGANEFEVPPSWVAQLVQAYSDAYQIPAEEKERFSAQFRPMAERQVRRDLILETIAEKEALAATEADLDDKVSEMAAKRGVEVGQLYASLQKAGRLKELERTLTEDKVFAWLYDKNTIDSA